jgi:uncharacterized UBP type Zn finger protein
MDIFLPEECFVCCTNLADPPGIFSCLECASLTGFCPAHAVAHQAETGHAKFALITTGETLTAILLEPSGSFQTLPSADHPELARLAKLRRYPADVFLPYPDMPRRPIVAGFFNLGNTCYLNSNLHVLFAMPEFVEYCLSEDCGRAGPLGFEFRRLVTELVTGRRQPLINGRLRLVLDIDHEEYLRPEPMDSIEFFNYLFSTIRRYLPDAPLSLAEFDEFVDVACASCGHTTRSSGSKSAHAIVIEPAETKRSLITDDIDRMLDRFCRFQKSGWCCPTCGGRTNNCTRSIAPAPKYLFVNNQLDFGTREPDVRFKRNLVLTLDPDDLRIGFASSGTARYRMIAFMQHVGRWAKFGHDTAFMREGDHWITFNDGDVTIVPNIHRQVVFGHQYLYLYSRIDE